MSEKANGESEINSERKPYIKHFWQHFLGIFPAARHSKKNVKKSEIRKQNRKKAKENYISFLKLKFNIKPHKNEILI